MHKLCIRAYQWFIINAKEREKKRGMKERKRIGFLLETYIKMWYFFCDGITSVTDKIKNVFCRLTNTFGEYVNRITKHTRIFVVISMENTYMYIGILQFDRCKFLFLYHSYFDIAHESFSSLLFIVVFSLPCLFQRRIGKARLCEMIY